MKKHIRHKRHRPKDIFILYLRNDEDNSIYEAVALKRKQLDTIYNYGKYVLFLNMKTEEDFKVAVLAMIEASLTQSADDGVTES